MIWESVTLTVFVFSMQAWNDRTDSETRFTGLLHTYQSDALNVCAFDSRLSTKRD